MLGTDTSEVFKSYRVKSVKRLTEPNPLEELEQIHEKKVFMCKVKDKKQLQASTSRSVYLAPIANKYTFTYKSHDYFFAKGQLCNVI